MTELRRGISFSGQFSDCQSLLSRYFRAGGFTVPARVLSRRHLNLTCHCCKQAITLRTTAQHPGRHCTSYAGSTFRFKFTSLKFSLAQWRFVGRKFGCLCFGRDQQIALAAQGWIFSRMRSDANEYERQWAGGGVVDFLPYRGMALDSESSCSLLKHVRLLPRTVGPDRRSLRWLRQDRAPTVSCEVRFLGPPLSSLAGCVW